ncbi:MAG: histidine phosphatase family protein [Clostridiales bacterium]|jgi:broad specificity phosphatase PhoE|nr:histidine phosphatase family protein [Clostridiales bacterium]
MNRLILIRHGETLWNREFRLQGSSDVPLSELGEDQAQRLARSFTEKPAAIFVSPLARTQSFAAPLASRFGLKPKVMENLREMSFGRFEGLRYEDMDDSLQQAFKLWIEDPVKNTSPDGESIAALTARVRKAAEDICDSLEEGAVALAVTHGGVIRAIVAALMDMPLIAVGRVQVYPGSLTILDKVDGHWKLVRLNDTCYIDS